MTSLAMVCLLLSLAAPIHSHIVPKFQRCQFFFFKGWVPRGFDPTNRVELCQKYEGSYYFTTLYDTSHRIPVYSAYLFMGESTERPNKHWLVEPQLVNQNWESSMMKAESVMFHHPGTNIEAIGARQAVNDDYKTMSNQYSRGHLSPSNHHKDDGRKASFTLTNVVPQNAKLNRWAWSLYEARLKTYCENMYIFIVVGAVPSANNLVNKRVNIPDYLWHAFCCTDKEGNPVKSGAAAARNTGENKLVECSVQSLERFLRQTNQGTVNLFGTCNAPAVKTGDCTTVR